MSHLHASNLHDLTWAWLYCGCGLSLSTIWPPQRTVLSWPMFTLLGNGKAQRLRSRGLAKGECRRRRKVKTRTALQPRVPRRMRAVRCRQCAVCSTHFACSSQACTHMESSTRPRTSMDMQPAFLTYTPCFTRDGETVTSTTDYTATDLRRLCHLAILDQTSGTSWGRQATAV